MASPQWSEQCVQSQPHTPPGGPKRDIMMSSNGVVTRLPQMLGWNPAPLFMRALKMEMGRGLLKECLFQASEEAPQLEASPPQSVQIYKAIKRSAKQSQSLHTSHCFPHPSDLAESLCRVSHFQRSGILFPWSAPFPYMKKNPLGHFSPEDGPPPFNNSDIYQDPLSANVRKILLASPFMRPAESVA